MASPHRRRLGALVVSGLVVLATACGTDDPSPTGATDSPTDGPTDTASQEPADPGEGEPSETPSESGSTGRALPVYFAGMQQQRARLFREFVRGEGGDPLTEAALLVDGGQPADPDYRTLWPGGTIERVEASDGLLVVHLNGDAFTEAPDGMAKREARLAIQQLVYTLQGVQQERIPVQFVRDAGPARLFGIDVSQPVRQASALRVLNHVNITEPAEGSRVGGGSLEVSGVANSFEANVVCDLSADGEVITREPFTAEGWMGDRLFPFSGEISLADVGPGDVVLTCSTDDPTGGAEGPGAFTDTKTVTVGS